MSNEIDEQISKFKAKLALLGDTVEINHIGDMVKLIKYNTNSSKLVLPDFINVSYNLAEVFSDSPNLKSVTLPPLRYLCFGTHGTSSIEELILNPKTRLINCIELHGGLRLVLSSSVTIRTNAIKNMANLELVNSKHISKVNYYGIKECTIDSITLKPYTLAQNSLIKCKIKELHLSHGQEQFPFRDTTVSHMYYYISKKHYTGFNRDDSAIIKHIREDLFFNSIIDTIGIVVI